MGTLARVPFGSRGDTLPVAILKRLIQNHTVECLPIKMNQREAPNFEIPDSLREQLMDYRRRLWFAKVAEAFALGVFGLLMGFLVVYILDRLFETSSLLRWLFFLLGAACCLAVPYALDRWVWRRRRMDQLAALLTVARPTVGDQVLGVIHLASDKKEQARSPELVSAALKQVASQLAGLDFSQDIPRPTFRRKGTAICVVSFIAGSLFLLNSAAAYNSLNRFLFPWAEINRYTFAQLMPLKSPMVVAKGEPIDFDVELSSTSYWKPGEARLHLASSVRYAAENIGDRFAFRLPGQVVDTTLDLSVGDLTKRVVVRPVIRPEIQRLLARVELPDYLQRTETLEYEVRSGSLSVVNGSRVELDAMVSRELLSASVDRTGVSISKGSFSTGRLLIEADRTVLFDWIDHYGLSPERSLELEINTLADEAPTLVCENLPLRKVLISSEVLVFQVRAYDDFGVKKVGLEWFEVTDNGLGEPLGETLLGAGGPDAESLLLDATFSAVDAGVTQGRIALRAYVEDYQPGVMRQYSPPSFFQVLDVAQHAVWLTEELTRWHQMSLDVRDREMQLHQVNLELQGLRPNELATAETRERLAKQADSERQNGRQLANLVRSGERLLREGMRNNEIDAEYLERSAKMVQVLKEISADRMPLVAELLEKASKSGISSETDNKQDGLKAGKSRLEGNPQTSSEQSEDPEEDSPPSTPSVSDIESSQLDLDKLPKSEGQKQKTQQGRLGLADTKLAGNAASESEPKTPETELDQAIIEQDDLLEEFEKVSGEMTEILGNLEGSTLVKRLKSASRQQQKVAAGLASLVSNTFGVPDREKHADRDAFLRLAGIESNASQEVSDLMDDMTAYFERSREQLLMRVLEQMKDQDVTAGLRDLGNQLRAENGLSISQAEYWSDNLDRWAEDLVEVTQSGASPGGKPKGSLPPKVVLEVLKILDDEVRLREQTRVAEQRRPVVTDTDHMNDANRLGELQESYQNRIDSLVEEILELPNAEGDFANELNLLGQVSGVMQEATEILYKPQTGPLAIAAETEIIELLLKSKRFNPNASGGSGSDPGGGGSGETEVSALALVGSGVNAKEIKEESEVIQATGNTQPGLPEEFRGGLDEYFIRLEAWKAK